MARPKKSNLYYFPLNVDFFEDPKVLSIEEASGLKGGYIAIRLMALVYQTNGWYLEWPDKFEMIIAKRIGNGVTGALVVEVLKDCLRHGLFHRDAFEKKGIITSRGIQKRWKMVMNQLRRSGSVTEAESSEYWLISSEETAISSEETAVSDAINHIKEKEKEKVNEKEEIGAGKPPTSEEDLPKEQEKTRKRNTGRAGRRNFVAPTYQEILQFFMQKVGSSKSGQAYWPEDRVKSEASKMYAHYSENGWKQAKGNPIIDWNATAWKWINKSDEIRREKEKVSNWTPAPKVELPPPPPEIKRVSTLTKLQLEINYLFGRYQEPESITIVSIEPMHYDIIKNAGMIDFDQQTVEDIRSSAREYINSASILLNEETERKFMKKYGVLEFFKQKQKLGAEEIFIDQAQTEKA